LHTSFRPDPNGKWICDIRLPPRYWWNLRSSGL
jgi:hypothetical protein